MVNLCECIKYICSNLYKMYLFFCTSFAHVKTFFFYLFFCQVKNVQDVVVSCISSFKWKSDTINADCKLLFVFSHNTKMCLLILPVIFWVAFSLLSALSSYFQVCLIHFNYRTTLYVLEERRWCYSKWSSLAYDRNKM